MRLTNPNQPQTKKMYPPPIGAGLIEFLFKPDPLPSLPCKEGARKSKSSISYQNLYVKDLWDKEGVQDERKKIRSLFNDSTDIDYISKIYIPYNKMRIRKLGLSLKVDIYLLTMLHCHLQIMTLVRCLRKHFRKSFSL